MLPGNILPVLLTVHGTGRHLNPRKLKYKKVTNFSNILQYSGTPLNGHPSTADTCYITDNSECPDRISIDFNTFSSGHPAITL